MPDIAPAMAGAAVVAPPALGSEWPIIGYGYVVQVIALVFGQS